MGLSCHRCNAMFVLNQHVCVITSACVCVRAHVCTLVSESMFVLHLLFSPVAFCESLTVVCLFVLTRSKSLSDIPMVYPVCKVPHGRIGSVDGQYNGVASDWNHEKAQCAAVAEDSEAQWQNVSAGGRKNPGLVKTHKVPKSQWPVLIHVVLKAVYDSVSGPDQVEDPSTEHKVGPSQEVTGQGARHQPDDQRCSSQLWEEWSGCSTREVLLWYSSVWSLWEEQPAMLW